MILALAAALLISHAWAEETAYFNPLVPPPLAPSHSASGDDYFEDAVFIGDSMMDDIEMFDLFPTGNFACLIGMSPLSAGRRQFRVKGSTEKQTVYEVAAHYEPKKIYLLLGSNSVDHKSSNDSLADYRAMMDEFIRRFPDTLFYIICPPPMTAKHMRENSLPVQRFANFHQGLKELAEEKHCYFIDFYEAIATPDGYLPARLDCGDGVHPNREGLEMLEQLIRCQTVDVE